MIGDFELFARHDPRMMHCIERFQASFRVPDEALGDKVDKQGVVALENGG